MILYNSTLKSSIIVVFLLHFISGYTQNTLQIIKFEEASDLFDNNKFKEAVSILSDLENQGLKNPKVLHLKILAKSNCDKQDVTEEFLNSLKTEINKYLKDYDIKGFEDKYKEVYLVSKNLNKYGISY